MYGKKNITIIGAGPGGLTPGIIQGKRGYKVLLFEKRAIGYDLLIGPDFSYFN